MAQLPPDKAEQLLQGGFISQGTYDRLVGSEPPSDSYGPSLTATPIGPVDSDPFKLGIAGGSPPASAQPQLGSIDLGQVKLASEGAPPQPVTVAPQPGRVTEEGGVTFAPKPQPQPQPASREAVANGDAMPPAPKPRPASERDRRIAVEEAKYSGVFAAEDRVADARRREVDVQKEAADAQSMANAISAAQRARDAADMKQLQDQAYADVKARQDALHREADELSKERIDTGRIWRNGPSSMFAALGMAFGVLGAPATGGRNLGVESVNRLIDRDIEAQKADLEGRRAALAQKRGLLAEYTALTKDRVLAEQMTRAKMLDATIAAGDAKVTQYKSQAIEASWGTTRSELDAQREGLRKQIGDRVDAQLRAEAAAAAAARLAERKQALEQLKDQYGKDRDEAWKRINKAQEDGRQADPADVRLVNQSLPEYAARYTSGQGGGYAPSAQPGAAGKKAEEGAKQLSEGLSNPSSALEAVDQAQKHFTGPDGKPRSDNIVYTGAPNPLRGSGSVADEQVLRRTAYALAKVRAGKDAEPNDAAIDTTMKELRGDGSAKAIERGLSGARDEIKRKIAGVRAGASPEANRLYDSRREGGLPADKAASDPTPPKGFK